MSKHETLAPFVNYATALVMLVTLALALRDTFGSAFLYAGLAVSAVFGVLIIWAYLPKRTVGKRKESLNKMLRHSSIATVIVFVMSCIAEVVGVYFLFSVAFLWGNYDMIIKLAEDFSVQLPPSNNLDSLYQSVAMSLFTLVEGAFGFAVVGYSLCLNQWAKWRFHLSRSR